MSAELIFVGHIKTPYQTAQECPGQARPENGTSQIIVDEKFASAINGLKPGDNIQVLRPSN